MDAIHVTSDIKIAGENRLLRILGISFGLAITIGAIISGGILRMPEVIAGNLGNEQLIVGVWILGGIWALAILTLIFPIYRICRKFSAPEGPAIEKEQNYEEQ